MKLAALLYPTVVLGATVPYGVFSPEKPTDARGVCPVLNTLANHGFLPRDGRNITEDILSKALQDSLNMAPALTLGLFDTAILANPQPKPTSFDIDQIDRHNVFEHDASLSRQDAFFGDWVRFNQTVWNWTLQYYTGDILDVQMIANARAQRLMRSQLTNPEFSYSGLGFDFSLGENAAIITIIGDKTTLTCPKKFLDYLFSKEKRYTSSLDAGS